VLTFPYIQVEGSTVPPPPFGVVGDPIGGNVGGPIGGNVGVPIIPVSGGIGGSVPDPGGFVPDGVGVRSFGVVYTVSVGINGVVRPPFGVVRPPFGVVRTPPFGVVPGVGSDTMFPVFGGVGGILGVVGGVVGFLVVGRVYTVSVGIIGVFPPPPFGVVPPPPFGVVPPPFGVVPPPDPVVPGGVELISPCV
jgi:hypothetical protein